MNDLRPFLFAAALLVGISLGAGAPAGAQDRFLEVSGDLSAVGLGADDVTWDVGRALGGVQRDGEFGWLVGAERQRRDKTVDWAAHLAGFRRRRPWTISGTASFAPDPDFLYRRSLEGELARDVGAGFVVHGGYRHLQFPDSSVHLIEPAVSWYLRGHEVQARGFLVRNSTTNETSATLLIRGSVEASPRVRLAAGAAVGSRIFDITSAANTNADGWTVYGFARVQATRHLSIVAGAGGAHEDPLFTQRTLSVGVRWHF